MKVTRVSQKTNRYKPYEKKVVDDKDSEHSYDDSHVPVNDVHSSESSENERSEDNDWESDDFLVSDSSSLKSYTSIESSDEYQSDESMGKTAEKEVRKPLDL